MFTSLQCKWVSHRLSEREDGELPSHKLDRVKAHLVECARCRRLAIEFAKTRELLGVSFANETHEDPNDWQALKGRLAAMPNIPAAPSLHYPAPAFSLSRGQKSLAFAAAAVVCVITAIELFSQNDTRPRNVVNHPQPPPEIRNQIVQNHTPPKNI